MTVMAFAFAFPLARRLGLSGSLMGLIGAQVVFQGILGVSLLLRSKKMVRELPAHCDPAV
jgi:hypothetical protein